MYMAIRQLKVQPGVMKEAIRLVETEMLPIISSMPGFIAYEMIQVGEDVGVTISLFETQEQTEASNTRAAEWVRPYLAPLAAGPHEILAQGLVRVRILKEDHM